VCAPICREVVMTSCRGLAVRIWQCISGERDWSLGVNVSSSPFLRTRGAATGEGVEFAGKQCKIRSRKYEHKEKNKSSVTVVMQAIMVASQSR
jgi:hypothetical protein